MAGQTTNYLFDYPTSTDYVKDGATAIQELADDVDATLFTALGGAYPGLRLIKKQTVGTGVSSVTVTGAFSAVYDNYKIVLNGIDSSAADNLINLSLNNSAGSTYYYATRWVNYSTAAFGGVVSGTPKTSLTIGLTSVNDNNNYSLELQNCFNARPTSISIQGSSDTNMVWGGGFDSNAASQTAFTLTPNAGTLTGGTIYVYGYGTS